MADLFIRDITQGIGTSGVKAAIIKCATDTAGVTPVIENILPALRAAGVTEEHIAQMLVHNPRAIFEARHGGQA